MYNRCVEKYIITFLKYVYKFEPKSTGLFVYLQLIKQFALSL